MITVLCCGDREWKSFAIPRRVLGDLLEHDSLITVVHGDCRGADKICGYIAHELGMIVKPEPADWGVGSRGGPCRNQYMLDKYKIDLVIAFHNDLKRSKGTKDMVNRAKKANIPIMLVSETNVQQIIQTKL
jgi:hypothetical protein